MLGEVIPGVADRCRVVYNCLSDEELAQPPIDLPLEVARVKVVMLGNIRVHHKGYDLACDALAQLRARRLPVELHVAGRPDELHRFKNAQERFGVEDLVWYHGETNDPAEFLRGGHIFLLASRMEGMPNALLEAMNLGLPCVSTRVGDVPRFAVDGEHLLLRDVDDASGLAASVEYLVKNWDHALQLGRAARELCQSRFTAARMASESLAILREVMAK